MIYDKDIHLSALCTSVTCYRELSLQQSLAWSGFRLEVLYDG